MNQKMLTRTLDLVGCVALFVSSVTAVLVYSGAVDAHYFLLFVGTLKAAVLTFMVARTIDLTYLVLEHPSRPHHYRGQRPSQTYVVTKVADASGDTAADDVKHAA